MAAFLVRNVPTSVKPGYKGYHLNRCKQIKTKAVTGIDKLERLPPVKKPEPLPEDGNHKEVGSAHSFPGERPVWYPEGKPVRANAACTSKGFYHCLLGKLLMIGF